MTEKTSTLAVFAHLAGTWAPGGLLTMVEDGPALIGSKFSYGRQYLRRPGALPIVPSENGWQPDPDTMLDREFMAGDEVRLFGAIRDAAPDAWGRRVIEARLKVPANALPESRYLLEAGPQRAGALDVRTDITAPPAAAAPARRLDYLLEAAARIEEGLPVPATLQDIFPNGSGMGGMRPKATILVGDDGDEALWLAKFPSTRETLDVPMLEAATLRLARAAGLHGPDDKALHTKTIGGKTVMLMRRFDREYPEPGLAIRRHMISALTLLGCHESRTAEKSYPDIADALRRHGSPRFIKSDTAELFGRMVFNIFVTNDDDHLRNHAFLWEPDGWRLSPLYDVVPAPRIGHERNLVLGIGAQGRIATIDNAMTRFARFGLDRKQAWEIVDRVWTTVRQWRVHFEEAGVPPAEIDKVAPAFRHIDDICSKETRRQAAEQPMPPPIASGRII